jgi:hypothetical protein
MADRNGYIGRAPSDSSVVVARQTFSPTGITTTFTFASGYVVGYLDLYLNGAKQIEGQDYDANNGSTFDVSGGGATNGDVIEAVAYKAFNVSALKDAPGDFTVGNQLTVVGHTTATQAVYTGVVTASSFSGDGSALTGVAGGKFSANATGISTTTSVGIGTTNATGAADSNNTAVLNVGVVTANFFYGNGANLTGVANTENVIGTAITMTTGNITGNLTVGGVLTYDDVTNVDSIGIVTARSGVKVVGGGVSITAGGLHVTAGITTVGGGLTLTDNVRAKFGSGGDLEIYHDGTNSVIDNNTGDLNIMTTGSGDDIYLDAADDIYLRVQGNESGVSIIGDGAVELYHNNSKKLETSATGVTVTGTLAATAVTGDGSGLSNLPAAGLNTAAATVAGIVTTLDLSSAQDHKITVSGVSTVTVKGGSEGESHTVRIINSGITTVGFSTFFLFPSGADPSMPTAISLISFTVNRVGAGGTQLLAGAALNYS